LNPTDIEREVRRLGPWFHNMELGGVMTAPGHFLGDYPRVKFARFEHAIPRDLRGRTVLDIGCNGGFYSLEMRRRGAERVVAIDSDDAYLRQARFAAEVSGVDGVEFVKMDVYDVASLRERFDLVLFMGVLYHLRHPLLALDLVHDHVVGDAMVFQSMQRGSDAAGPVAENYPFSERDVFDRDDWPKLHFVERRYADDPTNWWVPNRACAEAMLRSAGFEIVDRPEAEVYLCRRAEGAAARPPTPREVTR
jgi:tRNA (mo5U34)-methyltransferase